MTKSKNYQDNPNPIHDGLHNLLTGKPWSYREKSKHSSGQQQYLHKGASYDSNSKGQGQCMKEVTESIGGMRSWNDIMGRSRAGGGGGIPAGRGGEHLKYPRRGAHITSQRPEHSWQGSGMKYSNQRLKQDSQGWSISGQPGANPGGNPGGLDPGQNQGAGSQATLNADFNQPARGNEGWNISG